MKPEIRALVTYRLEQADETLDSAQSLLERGNYCSMVNLPDYVMFYAVQALLAPMKQ